MRSIVEEMIVMTLAISLSGLSLQLSYSERDRSSSYSVKSL